jgi:dihydrofolate reductase
MISIVVAYDKNRGIAQSYQPQLLPWQDFTGKNKYDEDMSLFKKLTMDSVVIMGRKTFDSLPRRSEIVYSGRYSSTIITNALKHRLNVVITKRPKIFHEDPNVAYYKDIQYAIDDYKKLCPDLPIFIIGGAEIYKLALALDLVDQVIASEIQESFMSADIHFPPISGFEEVAQEEYTGFNRVTYKRVR